MKPSSTIISTKSSVILSFCLLPLMGVGSPFSFISAHLTLTVLPRVNHADINLAVDVELSVERTNLFVASDSAFVVPVWDPENDTVRLSFLTSNMTYQSATVTLSISDGASHTSSMHILLLRDPMQIVRIVDDPFRSQVYALHQHDVNRGAVLVLDRLSGRAIKNITVGFRPTDFAITRDGAELLVLNQNSRDISVINLDRMMVADTLILTEFDNWGAGSGSPNLGVGPGDIIYYSDGAWASALRVFDRATRSVLQTVWIEGDGGYGFGDFGINPHHTMLYGWAQYGYGAGWAGSYISRFAISPSGLLSFMEHTASGWPTPIGRDPDNTPVLISRDGSRVFVKQLAVNATAISQNLVSFPAPVYSIADNASIVATESAVYLYQTGTKVFDLPDASPIQTITRDYTRLFYFHAASREVRSMDLMSTVGPESMGLNLTPADQSITLTPSQLQWPPVSGAGSYHIYLAPFDVTGADTNSSAYQGRITAPPFYVAENVTSGLTYYWRADAITHSGISTGQVFSFTVSTLATSTNAFHLETVRGHVDLQASLILNGSSTGTMWSATTSAPWISVLTPTGTVPGTLRLSINATELAAGIHTSLIVIAGGVEEIQIPLSLRVHSLELRHLKTGPTNLIYGISEKANDPAALAFLLEIDADSESIRRVIPVGKSVTDLAVHPRDQTVYVPNWQGGQILKVDMESLSLLGSLSVEDPFRVTAGQAGRIMVEQNDQWISIRLVNTVSGAIIAGVNAREGGGAASGDGRFYFHGDNNISSASLHKYDLSADVFTPVASHRAANLSYYGTRVITASDNGQRIFYNGVMYNQDLTKLWDINAHIYATTPDGNLAIGSAGIYDTVAQQQVLTLPVETTVTAYNPPARKLVLQSGNRLMFYPLAHPMVLAAPTLSAGVVTHQSAQLAWNDNTLETGFTLQYRTVGDEAWLDAPGPISANTTQKTISGLSENTTYEFRIKANSPAYAADWSDVLTLITAWNPPSTPSLYPLIASFQSVLLNWTDSNLEDGYVVERSEADPTSWSVISQLPANMVWHEDTNVLPGHWYYYRIKAIRPSVSSAYSNVRSVQIPQPPPPTIPEGFITMNVTTNRVELHWQSSSSATGYRLERRTDEEAIWSVIAILPAYPTAYSDETIQNHFTYHYRLFATNLYGSSASSEELAVEVGDYQIVFEDDFDPDIDPSMWTQIYGGEPRSNATGYIRGNALVFAGHGIRNAVTIPVDMTTADKISFWIRAGNQTVDGILWDNSEAGESIALEYSMDGTTWNTWTNFTTVYPALSTWNQIILTIPDAAQSAMTRFRWRQLSHSGPALDVWALDEITIHARAPNVPSPPPFILASALSDTQVAIFWAAAPGASRYRIERQGIGSGWRTVGVVSSAQTFFTDASALPSRLYGYKVRSENPRGASAYTITAFAKTYSLLEAWLLANYGTTEPVGPASLLALDSEGIENVLKYAFNLPANEPSLFLEPEAGTIGFPTMWINPENGRLTGEFIRRKPQLDPGISYLIQFSDGLDEWTDSNNIVSVTTIDQVWERVRFEDIHANTSMRFSRILVKPLPDL